MRQKRQYLASCRGIFGLGFLAMSDSREENWNQTKQIIEDIAREVVSRRPRLQGSVGSFYYTMNDRIDYPMTAYEILDHPQPTAIMKRAVIEWLDRWDTEEDFRNEHLRQLNIPTEPE